MAERASAEDGLAAFARRLAADRDLRRGKYPLTVKLIGQGAARQSTPVTLSIACGEGDYRAGRLCPVLDGKELPAQVNVLATWPGDRLVKACAGLADRAETAGQRGPDDHFCRQGPSDAAEIPPGRQACGPDDRL